MKPIYLTKLAIFISASVIEIFFRQIDSNYLIGETSDYIDGHRFDFHGPKGDPQKSSISIILLLRFGDLDIQFTLLDLYIF